MHAKYSVLDDDWIIETANWTRASFGSNREFFMTGDDEAIYKNLSALFLADFERGE
jgi:phosphatidylserine/phosphatidylglycerophosphate/cardiolipin synthase-like enzyme